MHPGHLQQAATKLWKPFAILATKVEP